MSVLLRYCILLTVLLLPCLAQESRYAEEYTDFYNGPYRQVYPPADITQDIGNCTPSATTRCPLYVVYMSSFGGAFASAGSIPGVQIALDQINDDPFMLPGYTLHYVLRDSQCDRGVALQSFHTHIIQPPTKLGVIGSGCSVATEATAELAPFYNLTQISCVSSSTELENQQKFPRYFQMSASENNLVYGFFGLIKFFEWRRVAILTQDENLFTVTINDLRELLEQYNITDIRERGFETNFGLEPLAKPLFDPESRIFILGMFPNFAARVLCEAHIEGLRYPQIQFIIPGWYTDGWWRAEGDEDLASLYPDCSVEDREAVLLHTLAPRKAGRTFEDGSIRADSGYTGDELADLYDRYLQDTSLGISFLNFYQQCYDATWTFARALNMTLADITNDPTLSASLAEHNSALMNSEDFNIQHFTYNNSKFLELMFQHMQATEFNGIVGPIKFTDNGIRKVNTVDAQQYQIIDGRLKAVKIADIMEGVPQLLDTELVLLDTVQEEDLFPFGVPLDGVPCEVVVGVLPVVTGIFVTLSIIGISLAVMGMSVHCILRNKPVVRLSSPNLNMVIGFGAIILYTDIIINVIPTTSQMAETAICNLQPWLTSVGYSLCFGTILAKMVRVYYIFDNPSKRKKKTLQDWHLALGVGVLVAIDCIILLLYDAIEANNLGARLEPNRENLQDITGDLLKITNYYVYVCDSKARSITLGILYGYKMLLQIIALIFAFSIRKVKIKGLNDAKFIAAAVYVTSLVTAIVIVITYTLNGHVNLSATLFCIGFFIGATTILGLVMIPPLVNHAKDPLGEKIFQSAESSYRKKMSLPTNTLGSGQSGEEVVGLKRKIVELQSKLSLMEDKNGELLQGTDCSSKSIAGTLEISSPTALDPPSSPPPNRESDFKGARASTTSKVTLNLSSVGSSPGTTTNCSEMNTNGEE